MDNLITAVIAIGLLAVVTIMSVNYGTEAILNYQAKMDATRIVADAENIAAAWKEYARANNGSPFNASASCNVQGLLVTNYLASWPVPPRGAAASASANYHDILLTSVVYQSSTEISNVWPTDTIALLLKSPRVCLAIANMAGFTGPTAKTTNLLGDLSAVSSRRPYDCIYVDADGSGQVTQSDPMIFIYRVFDQNNFPENVMPPC
jgi:hypothetical protein